MEASRENESEEEYWSETLVLETISEPDCMRDIESDVAVEEGEESEGWSELQDVGVRYCEREAIPGMRLCAMLQRCLVPGTAEYKKMQDAERANPGGRVANIYHPRLFWRGLGSNPAAGYSRGMMHLFWQGFFVSMVATLPLCAVERFMEFAKRDLHAMVRHVARRAQAAGGVEGWGCLFKLKKNDKMGYVASKVISIERRLPRPAGGERYSEDLFERYVAAFYVVMFIGGRRYHANRGGSVLDGIDEYMEAVGLWRADRDDDERKMVPLEFSEDD